MWPITAVLYRKENLAMNISTLLSSSGFFALLEFVSEEFKKCVSSVCQTYTEVGMFANGIYHSWFKQQILLPAQATELGVWKRICQDLTRSR